MRALPITRMSSVDPDQRVLSGLTCSYSEIILEGSVLEGPYFYKKPLLLEGMGPFYNVRGLGDVIQPLKFQYTCISLKRPIVFLGQKYPCSIEAQSDTSNLCCRISIYVHVTLSLYLIRALFVFQSVPISLEFNYFCPILGQIMCDVTVTSSPI